MSKLSWDGVGERLYHLGVSHGVLFVRNKGKYQKGVAWNGLSAVNETPDGADANDVYADNAKYVSIRSAENYKYTIESYTYPDEFEACDGSAEIVPGVHIGQQKREHFGFSWQTRIGADDDEDKGYIIHIVWNSTASPSDKNHETVNDSPDPETFSWECDTTPEAVDGYRPTAHMTINSTLVDPEKLKKLEEKLYGTEGAEPALPTPEEVIALLTAA